MFPFLISFLARVIVKDVVKDVIEKTIIKKALEHPLIKRALSLYSKLNKAKELTTPEHWINALKHKALKNVKHVEAIENIINQFNKMRSFKKHVLRQVNISNKLPAEIIKKITNLDKEFKGEKALDDEVDNVEISKASLNSSWLNFGIWYPTVESLITKRWQGNLILSIKESGTYTYFGVGQDTWEAMKDNNHAGTIFWEEYLRKIYGYSLKRHPEVKKRFSATYKKQLYHAPQSLIKQGKEFRNTVYNKQYKQTVYRKPKQRKVYIKYESAK